MNENLIQASHSAAFMYKDLLKAHKYACNENQIAEYAIFELLQEANNLKNKIERFTIACGADLDKPK